MNLIYSCVFFKSEYINLVELLLKSYVLYGNSNKDTDYLIICNSDFEEKIKKIIACLGINGFTWCLNLRTIFEAGYSRLKIFEYPNINKYNKILYLDCDILVTNSLSNILDFIIDDKLYALEEGETTDVNWGTQFFSPNPNISAFTSGILLFNNCETIKILFNEILEHISNHLKEKKTIPVCLDQPFIVYHAISKNLYNNKKLIGIVINNPSNFNGETISHFPGGPGHYESKIVKMSIYMNNVMMKKNTLNIPEIIPMTFINKIKNGGFTLVSNERLTNLYKQCIKFKDTDFSFVECGVAKGGCLAMMKYCSGKKNKVFGLDSFDGMPNITEKDIGTYNKSDPLKDFGKVGDNLSGGIDNVYITFNKLGLNMENVDLIKGFFEETLEKKNNIDKIGKICVLRLDGDWYNSVKICLDKLYENVIDGGVIIIDDYGHFIGAKNAVDEFRKKNNISSPLIQTDYTEFYWIKNDNITSKNNLNIYDDVWTCSDEFRNDIKNFFEDGKNMNIAEVGSHKGYTTKFLSETFKKVYALDNSIEWTNFNKNYNKDKDNIEYIMLDLYKDSWSIIPNDIDIVFIDADHHYEGCMSDVKNSLKYFNNLKYIIFDDYGVWPGVKKCVDEFINNNILEFQRYIGLNNVPGPQNKIYYNTIEGIICKVCNREVQLINKKYTWEGSHITFLESNAMDAFGKGQYYFINDYLVKADFGGREHYLKFNDKFNEFISIRKGDFYAVNGKQHIK
jgi:O-methyltransferase